jgi:prepilin-type N-terminal cleavage/methylation domain-containing protein
VSFRPQIPAPAPNQTDQIEDSPRRETGNAGDLESYSALQIPSCAFRFPPRHSAFRIPYSSLTSLRAVRPYRQEADLPPGPLPAPLPARRASRPEGRAYRPEGRLLWAGGRPPWLAVANQRRRLTSGFTLVELTAVILIIATLAALVLTAASSMYERAKRTQIKNDLTQLVTAINAFYTEYGQYPVAAQTGADSLDYPTSQTDANNAAVMDVLRVPDPTTPPALNPRGIVFLNVPVAKSTTTPIGGIGTTTRAWYDPWGSAYRIRIDNNYNGLLVNPYTSNAGPASLNLGCIAWSLGKNKGGGSGNKNTGTNLDDVLSWQ